MIWLRKGIVHILSLVLFAALLSATLAASIDIAFGHPAKLENWLVQSNLYGNFVSNAIKQANASAGNSGDNGQSVGVSLNDVAVQQAADSAFSPSLLQQDVNTFLNSNYAWLEGKTPAPEFSIDLSAAKASFAQKVGQYVQAHLAGLPVCTVSQLPAAQQQLNNDPLSLTCRPAAVDPATEGANTTKQLSSTTGFLSNPVITAKSINPNGGTSAQPYYQKFSNAPRIYRLVTKLPMALAAIALLSAIGICFIAPRRRTGWRRIGIVLFEVGILLTAVKFVADAAFKRIENKIFNQVNNGPLQQSLTEFAHRAESQIVNVDLYFGIAFIVLAIAIIIVLLVTRSRSTKVKAPGFTGVSPSPNTTPTAAVPDGPQAKPARPTNSANSRSKRPPRLIQ